jgi:hypothetical protein
VIAILCTFFLTDCYIGSHNDLLLKTADGALFEDPDWENEYFLDTSTDAKRQALAAIINPWIAKCASDGFQAIEPDNLDVRDGSNPRLSRQLTLYHEDVYAVGRPSHAG